MRSSGTPLTELKRFVQSKGWQWQVGKTIPYGEQIVVSQGSDRVTVNYYPKRHAMVPGGAASPLKAALESWIGSHAATQTTASRTVGEKVSGTFGSIPHIGMDESGKGDWFGPLVVAAVHLEPAEGRCLHSMGVRDSKTVEAGSLSRLAREIKSLIPEERRRVRVLLPEEYNRRYAATPNLNRLLADVYAETAADVWPASRPEVILCDQFAQNAALLEGTFRRRGLPKPMQQTRAESASIAVAAASVLATSAFSRALKDLGEESGIGGPLPKGASAIGALRKAARHILQHEGVEGLGRYAKLHFKPIQELLNPLLRDGG